MLYPSSPLSHASALLAALSGYTASDLPLAGRSVVVALSGGVDSAVAAALLMYQGADVQAVFMQNWEAAADDSYCTAEEDLADARAVCDHLGIPLHTVSFAKDYWERVFQRCLDDFAAGFTPNPDVLCNPEIKFSPLLDYAKQLGADFLATGHYAASLKNSEGYYQLQRAADESKDQSYFLHLLSQQQLASALFPLARCYKKQVRALAQALALPNANKADSTGLCFIGERRFKPFLAEFLLAQPGDIIDEKGAVLGRHDGLMFYTLGQRQGLALGGQRGYKQAPWYVIAKHLKENVLVVGQGHDHPALLQRSLITAGVHWINPDQSDMDGVRLQAQIRYRQRAVNCQLQLLNGDKESVTNCYRVVFDAPQWAITPGQSVVFYQQDHCLGGARIQSLDGAGEQAPKNSTHMSVLNEL